MLKQQTVYGFTRSPALDKVLHAEQARYTEEFAKLEKQFNDVRREHTKAVVALRQAERVVEREKEKAAEQLSLQQKEYEMKLEKCCSQLRNVEKERNMLMATVRQEGFKVPRHKPREFSGENWTKSLYTLALVVIFSSLFSIHFLRD